MINVGTIPENFSFTDVYTFHVATLPSLLVARRASADELIWDADGGFTDQWNDRSSVEGNPTDGYDFHIARRSFSVAGLPIFAAGTAGGGGTGILDGDVTGDSDDNTVTSLQGVDLDLAGAVNGDVIKMVGGEWVADPDAGGATLAGDVNGPADTNEVTSIQGVPIDPAGTEGQVITLVGGELVMADAGGGGAGFSPAVYRGRLTSPSRLAYSAGGGWNAFFGAIVTSGGRNNWADDVQTGITRSTGDFTVAAAGWYQVDFSALMFVSGAAPLRAVRMKVNGTVVFSEVSYTVTAGGALLSVHAAFLLAASDVLSFEYATETPTAGEFEVTSNQIASSQTSTANISIHRFS